MPKSWPGPPSTPWKDRESCKQTHWRRFQEAVKEHQNETWQLLENRNFQGLELPDL
jgi:hypothetical protein